MTAGSVKRCLPWGSPSFPGRAPFRFHGQQPWPMLLLVLLALNAGAATGTTRESFDADVVVFDERFHDVFAETPRIEVLAGDLGWAEGPLWVASLNALLFSDVAQNRVYRWDDTDGLSIFLSPSGHAPDGGPRAWRGFNGLAIDGLGRLLLAQQGAQLGQRFALPISS